MNNRELAKDFVVALISSGKIDTAQSSVQTYFDIISMLERNEDAPQHIDVSEPYDPFKDA